MFELWPKHLSGRVLTRKGLVPEPRRQLVSHLTERSVLQALLKLRIDPTPDFLALVHEGAVVELEHTPDPLVAVQIALDHLQERLDYYKRLKLMEQS